MILIVGGRNQGKWEFARSLMKKLYDREDGGPEIVPADGERDEPETAFVRPAVRNFHLFLRRCLKEGRSCEAFTGRLLRENPEAVVILDEIGCGVVPMDEGEREYRDTVGRMGQLLAGEAEAVYRVICGIGQRIK